MKTLLRALNFGCGGHVGEISGARDPGWLRVRADCSFNPDLDLDKHELQEEVVQTLKHHMLLY